jgi:hypothetical protein
MIFFIALLMAVAGADEALCAFQIQAPTDFKIIQQSEQKAGERKILNVELRGDGADVNMVIVGPLDQKQFENYSKLEIVAFEHLYESAITPYPDKISHETSCPKEFHPRKSVEEVFGKKADVYSAKANSRKIFGVCTKAEAAFDGAISIVHLTSGYAVKISAFVRSGFAAKIISRFKAIPTAR